MSELRPGSQNRCQQQRDEFGERPPYFAPAETGQNRARETEDDGQGGNVVEQKAGPVPLRLKQLPVEQRSDDCRQ